jgi:hypothetical protein
MFREVKYILIPPLLYHCGSLDQCVTLIFNGSKKYLLAKLSAVLPVALVIIPDKICDDGVE